MKSLQVILILSFLILLNCSDRSILICAVQKVGSGYTDNFMSKFNKDPETAFSYFQNNKDVVTSAINACK